MTKFRWLLVVPVCILSWFVVLFLGVFLLGVIESLCPAEQMTSGACYAPWFNPVQNSVIVIFSSVAASVVVITAYLLAPMYKVRVAIVALLVGALVATYSLYDTGAWLEYIFAIVGGVLATYSVAKVCGDRNS